MSFFVQQYSKRSAEQVWHEFGDKSKTFQFHACQVDAEGNHHGMLNSWNADAENTFFHNVMLRPHSMGNPHGSGLETHVGFSIILEEIEDVMAMAETFGEMVSVAKQMEAGTHSGEQSVNILRRGKRYAFEMEVSAQTLQFMIPGPGGSLQANHSHKATPFTNCFSMYVIVGGELILMADFSLYGAMRSALLVAHDLAVIKAVLDGVPESEIQKMEPHAQKDPSDPDAVAAMIIAAIEANKAAQPE